MTRGLAAALALLLGATACAPGTARASTRTLNVVMADDWASAPTVRAVIEAFEAAHDGVRVHVHGAPFSQIPDLLDNAADLEQPYDLAHWHAFAAGAVGQAQDVGHLWEQHGLTADRYLPGAVADVTWAGVRYGVPLDVNALVLLADGQALENAGLTAADLHDVHGFRDVAGRLVRDGGARHAISVSASTWAAYGWIRSFGGDLLRVARDGTPTFTFTDPATIAALDLLRGLVEDGSAPPPFSPDLTLDSVQAFTQGAVAMHSSGSWDLPSVRRAVDPGVDVDRMVVLPMPRAAEGDTATVLGGSSLFVPTGSEQAELAFELILALTADNVAFDLAVQEGRLPAAVHLYQRSPFTDDVGMRTFVTELERADVMPLIAFPRLQQPFGEAVDAILKGEVSAASAMRSLQDLAERLDKA